MSQRSKYDDKKRMENSLKKKSYDELIKMKNKIYDEIEEKSEKREINSKIISSSLICGIGLSGILYFSALGVGDVGGVILSGLGTYGALKVIPPSIKKEDIEKNLLEKNRELLEVLDKEINRKRNLEHIFEYDSILKSDSNNKERGSNELLKEFFEKEFKPEDKTPTIPKKNIPIEDSIFEPSPVFQKKTETSKVSSVEETREKQKEKEKTKNKEKISTKIVTPLQKEELTEKEKEELRKNMTKVKPYVSPNPGDPFRNYGPQKSIHQIEKPAAKEERKDNDKPSNSYNANKTESPDPYFDEIMRIFNGIDDGNGPKKR